MATDFDKMLKLEDSKKPLADNYYLNVWKASKIERQDFNIVSGKQSQLQDIDVVVALSSGREVKVSEKFREKDYGDFLVEAYTENKLGTGLTSKADGICYFVPGKCYNINNSDVKRLVEEITQHDSFKEAILKLRTSTCAFMNFKGNIVKALKTESTRRNRTWENINLCISWKSLKNLGVRFTEKPLN